MKLFGLGSYKSYVVHQSYLFCDNTCTLTSEFCKTTLKGILKDKFYSPGCRNFVYTPSEMCHCRHPSHWKQSKNNCFYWWSRLV